MTKFILGLIIGFFLRYFYALADERSRRFDEICENIDSLAQAAYEYWLKDAENELREDEIKIKGLSHKTHLLVNNFVQDQEFKHIVALEEYISFQMLVTGGEFEVHEREKDPDQALGILVASAELIGVLRKESEKRLNLRRHIVYVGVGLIKKIRQRIEALQRHFRE